MSIYSINVFFTLLQNIYYLLYSDRTNIGQLGISVLQVLHFHNFPQSGIPNCISQHSLV